MKKSMSISVITILAIGVCAVLSAIASKSIIASGADPFETPVEMRCTCYTDTGITASGQHTRPGIIAGKREWMGCTAALYDINEDGSIGDFIGYYEVLDTGAGIDTDGDGYGDSLDNGTSIDVWVPNDAAVREWQQAHGDFVMCYLIKGVG